MNSPLITIDIGNSRIKLGRFATDSTRLPEPNDVLELDANIETIERAVGGWLDEFDASSFRWAIASVNRPSCQRLVKWIGRRQGETHQVLSCEDLDLQVDLPQPEGVGIDRLLAAVAANRMRDVARPVVIADVGTAITVDAVSAAGVFLGGAILPGIRMSARALKQQTDLLPDIELIQLDEAPAAVGKSTQQAIHSGLFWGAVGAIRELTGRYAQALAAEPQIILTGGAAPAVARLLGSEAIYDPHLVLAGIAISARRDGTPK